MSRRRYGFTLVELLVVIGIIAVLVAILLPALSKARESAKSAECLSNLRQIGLAFAIYGDSGGKYYPTYKYTNALGHTVNWYHVIFPRSHPDSGHPLESRLPLFCPSGLSYPGSAALISSANVSYGYNSVGLGGINPTGSPVPVPSFGGTYDPTTGTGTSVIGQALGERPWLMNPARLNGLKRSSEVLIVGDAWILTGQHPDWFVVTTHRNPPNGELVPRHKGGWCNLLWGDGHADSMKSINGQPAGLYDTLTLGNLPSLVAQGYKKSKNYPYAWGRAGS